MNFLAIASRLIFFSLSISSVLQAAPYLQSDQRNLVPESKILLNFDQAMIPESSNGKITPNSILTIKPPLSLKLKWNNPTQAEIVFQDSPLPATTYTFQFNNDLKYLNGNPVPPASIYSMTTESLALVQEMTVETNIDNFGERLEKRLLLFNWQVNAEKAEPKIYYIAKDGTKLAAVVQQAKREDLKRMAFLSHEQAFRKETLPPLTPENRSDFVPNALIIRPESPLPAKEGWRIILQAGLPSVLSSPGLASQTERYIGHVHPLSVTSCAPQVLLDGPPQLYLEFNKSLAKYTDEDLKRLIQISPLPADLTLHRHPHSASILTWTGQFDFDNEYHITISSDLSSSDRLFLEKGYSSKCQFRHLEPSLLLPSFDNGLMARGKRHYEFQAVNIKESRIRVKHLKGAEAARALEAYRHYQAHGPRAKEVRNGIALPFELIPGQLVLDETRQFRSRWDQSITQSIDWNPITKANQGLGVYFLEVESKSIHSEDRIVTQSVLQITDIGLAWKFTNKDSLLFAFSMDTGQPLPGCKFTIYGSEGKVLHEVSADDQGTALLPRTEQDYYVTAAHQGDFAIQSFGEKLNSIAMWNFPVRFSYHTQPESERRVFIFSERKLYRPAETVHLKAIFRDLRGNQIAYHPDLKAELKINNSRGQVIHSQEIDWSEHGTFDIDFKLPEEEVGQFSAHVSFEKPEAPQEQESEDTEDEESDEDSNWYENYLDQQQRNFFYYFNVQDFRRNAFEIRNELSVKEIGATSIDAQLAAHYYQGQALAQAKVQWYLRSSKVGFYPDNYRDYLFGNHLTYDAHYWNHYFGFRDQSYHSISSESSHGLASLDAAGETTLALNIPKSDFPSPQTHNLSVEITDARDQTLLKESTLVTHPVDSYLGLKRQDQLCRVGNDIQFPVIWVTHDGQPISQAQDLEVLVERLWTEKLMTQSADGERHVDNQEKRELVATFPLSLDANGQATLQFKPTHSGEHLITLVGKDRAGRLIKTGVRQQVYGSNEFPWTYEEGMRIKLIPEKRQYLAGETARILVQSPIEGTALITMEREGVLRRFITELKLDRPIIEIPLTDLDTPNCFLSVMLIQGAASSAKEHKEALLKIGFCELLVQPRKEVLNINLDKPSKNIRPNAATRLNGLIRDADGKPVVNSEVALFATDEGVLSVAGYDNPDPIGYFYEPRYLRVKTGLSLEHFLSENPEVRELANKGFFVGGGDAFGNASPMKLHSRENFSPCAIWAPRLKTDAEGRFHAEFITPDTLTRYRVIAVATHGASRFGQAVSDFIVDKPIMLEAADPRFANEGDQIDAKVLIINRSEHAGVWDLEFQGGKCTQLIGGDGTKAIKTVRLDKGAQIEVCIPVKMTATGQAEWSWTATPKSLDQFELSNSLQIELSDRLISRFTVKYPGPALSDHQVVILDENTKSHAFSKDFDSKLMKGKGSLELTVSPSQFSRMGRAGDYLLSYPYGCIEQTSSSLLPWLVMNPLKPYLPRFNKVTDDQRDKAIQHGVKRLLSMQTPNGGFSYWPGSEDDCSWGTPYAAMVLLLAQEQGIELPALSVDKLCEYLNIELRKTDVAKMGESSALSLLVLSGFDHPNQAYLNQMLANSANLSESARCYLAIAFLNANVDGADLIALRLLDSTNQSSTPKSELGWMSYQPSAAHRLLAFCILEEMSQSPEILAKARKERALVLNQIFDQANQEGHWSTTWGNGWSIFALSTAASFEETDNLNCSVTIKSKQDKQVIQLDRTNPSQSISLPIQDAQNLLLELNGKQAVVIGKLTSNLPIDQLSGTTHKSGLAISRTYHRVLPNGKTEPLVNPSVGDLVQVNILLSSPGFQNYVAIDDPLPACFEAINPEFASQMAATTTPSKHIWNVSRQELRDDRVLFFCDYLYQKGSQELSYLARITRSGEFTAPQCKAELMYSPKVYALSPHAVLKVSPRRKSTTSL